MGCLFIHLGCRAGFFSWCLVPDRCVAHTPLRMGRWPRGYKRRAEGGGELVRNGVYPFKQMFLQAEGGLLPISTSPLVYRWDKEEWGVQAA